MLRQTAMMTAAAATLVSSLLAPLAQADDAMVIMAQRSVGLVESGAVKGRLSADESLVLQSKGRVWAVKSGTDSDHNVICMNPSASEVTLTHKYSQQPWLSVADSAACESVKPGLYRCPIGGSSDALLCRTQKVAKQQNKGAASDVTAVALRSLDTSDEAFFRIANQVMAQHKVHLDLCQDLHGQHEQGGVSFRIQAAGTIDSVSVIESGELATPDSSQAYAGCVAQAIGLWQFPPLDYVYEMEYAFLN